MIRYIWFVWYFLIWMLNDVYVISLIFVYVMNDYYYIGYSIMCMLEDVYYGVKWIDIVYIKFDFLSLVKILDVGLSVSVVFVGVYNNNGFGYGWIEDEILIV